MKGEVIHITEVEGIILTEDGKRFKFQMTEWKSEQNPQKGDVVDFVEDGEEAKEIILLESKKTDLSNLVNLDDIKNIKIIGGIGSLLLFFTWIPVIGLILGIVGFIMLSVAIKKISDKAPEKEIFKKWIIALIIAVLAMILGTILSGSMMALVGSFNGDDSATIAAMGIGSILLIVFAIAIQIVLGILYKQVFHLIADVTHEKLFRTAGTLFFWGGILYIIVIGAFLSFIAWILVTIAFFSMKTSE